MSDVSNVHAKLAEVHMQLMGMKIKKTGHNAHKHFDYYELSDIIPPVTQECHKQGLTLEFAFCEDVAILKIVDWENPKDYIPFRIKMPEIIVPEKNPNNQIIQTAGANISYLQRYLLKLAFPCLSDKDVIDSAATVPYDVNFKPANQEPQTEVNVPQLIVEAEANLKKKGVPAEDITPKALKQTVLKLKKWTVPERRVILNYFKEASK